MSRVRRRERGQLSSTGATAALSAFESTYRVVLTQEMSKTVRKRYGWRRLWRSYDTIESFEVRIDEAMVTLGIEPGALVNNKPFSLNLAHLIGPAAKLTLYDAEGQMLMWTTLMLRPTGMETFPPGTLRLELV